MDCDLLVVGGGIIGLSTARAAAAEGRSVVLIDPRPLLNDHNASNDESKVFRLAYGEDVELVALAKRALAAWRELERESGRRILHATGLFMFDGPFARASVATLRELGEPCEEGARVGGFRGEGVVDPQGGWLDPTQALAALEESATRRGVRVLRGVLARVVEARAGGVEAQLAPTGLVRAARAVIAAGFHAPELVPSLARRIVVTRQPELFFRAPSSMPPTPTFAAFEEGFYGFPATGGALKVADHRKGAVVRDFDVRAPPSQMEVDEAREWLTVRIPMLADAALVRWRVCLYDNAPGDRFILEEAGERVFVAAGMSGHAFKFGPALGDVVAARLRA